MDPWATIPDEPSVETSLSTISSTYEVSPIASIPSFTSFIASISLVCYQDGYLHLQLSNENSNELSNENVNVNKNMIYISNHPIPMGLVPCISSGFILPRGIHVNMLMHWMESGNFSSFKRLREILRRWRF